MGAGAVSLTAPLLLPAQAKGAKKMIPTTVQSGWWRNQAISYLNFAEARKNDPNSGENLNHPGLWALLGRATAELYGWDHPNVQPYFDRCLSLRLPNGGYGEATAWDAFGDGTVNPADTAYAIVTSDFVGMHLLAAYDHGIITLDDLTPTVNCVINWPQTGTSGGYGIPDYSRSPNDHGKPYVWNITASLASFLLYARFRYMDQGQPLPGYANKVSACLNFGSYWKNRVIQAYNPSWRGWQYCTPGYSWRQDGPHNAVITDTLQAWMGGTAAANSALYQLQDGVGRYTEEDYIGGAIRLLYLPSASAYVDSLAPRVGTVAQGFTSAGGAASWSFMANRVQTASYV